MSILTQGTQVFALVPPLSGTGPFTVMEVECATSFDPGARRLTRLKILA